MTPRTGPDLEIDMETVCRLEPPGDDWRLVTAAPDTTGGADFLFERRPAHEDRRVVLRTGSGTIPTGRTPAPRTYLIVQVSSGGTQTIELGPFSAALDFVGRLNDGRFVVASCRCRLEDGVAEENLWVISPTGQVETSFTAGDGVSHLVIDGRDRIWLGYFDEGVYGNLGWGHAGGVPPIGACGLRAVSASGTELWQHQQVRSAVIDDVYAMTGLEDGIVVYAYDMHQFLSVTPETEVSIFGALDASATCNAFAINPDWLLSRDHRAGIRLHKRDGNSVTQVAQLRLPGAFGGVWSGRGWQLNHFDATGWKRLNLDDAVAAYAART